MTVHMTGANMNSTHVGGPMHVHTSGVGSILMSPPTVCLKRRYGVYPMLIKGIGSGC